MEVLTELKRWQIEATNPRNDGHVQEGFKNKLQTICSFLRETKVTPCLETYVYIEDGAVVHVEKEKGTCLHIIDYDVEGVSQSELLLSPQGQQCIWQTWDEEES